MTKNTGAYWTLWSNASGDWKPAGRRYKEERALEDVQRYARKWHEFQWRVTAPDGKLIFTTEEAQASLAAPARAGGTGDANNRLHALQSQSV